MASMTRTWFITGTSSGFGRTLRSSCSDGDTASPFGDCAGRSVLAGGARRDRRRAVRYVVDAAFDAFGTIDVVNDDD
jgi:hypothetical protein